MDAWIQPICRAVLCAVVPQTDLAARGVAVARVVLCSYIKWIADNFETQQARQVYLPNIGYDADTESFMFMA